MAENPQKPDTTARPLSPHLTIYRWPVTMMTSITHRASGLALSLGALILAWWLVCISNGPEGWQSFHGIMDTPLGLLVLFGLTWSLAFHFFSGLRHLAWDLGYGFGKDAARQASILVIGGSLVVAVAIFFIAWGGYGGYLR